MPLGMFVELDKLLNPLHRHSILGGLQMHVGPAPVPWVEGSETDHVEGMLRDDAAVLLQHLVHILVLAPGHRQVRDAALWRVHSNVAAVELVPEVRIALERSQAESALLRRRAAHWEGVAHHGPRFELASASKLWKRKDLSDAVQKANEVEPVMLGPLLADPLRHLESVDAVRQIAFCDGIALACVQKGDHVHNGEFAFVELEPLLPLLRNEVHRLAGMHGVVHTSRRFLAVRVLVLAEHARRFTTSVLRVLPSVQHLDCSAGDMHGFARLALHLPPQIVQIFGQHHLSPELAR
mmetsp:Transcript_109573/g.309113  ORF Transcript_109573/g.309113 Transcript_109573/m.309113 type:complete len:294 (+) Transcript_109573:309-1190(+)